MIIKIPEPLEHQYPVWADPARFKVLNCGRRWGKALSLDTEIPTPTGWTTMRDISVGDQVFDCEGNICNVTAVTEDQIDRPCFQVNLSGGVSVIADADHLWLTDNLLERKSKGKGNHASDKRRIPRGPEVRTTSEIRESLRHGSRGDLNHSISNCGPIQTTKKYLLIDPYFLGIWLGDGTASSSNITTMDQEVIRYIESIGLNLILKVKAGRACTYKVAYDTELEGSRGVKKTLGKDLISLGLKSNKHVPVEYLRASKEQRLLLLQGLMDSDGNCRKNGRCEFDNTNRRLAQSAYELVCSLGWKAKFYNRRSSLNGKDCGPSYRVSFTPTAPVFKIKRKLNRQKLNGYRESTRTRRMIESIDPVPSVTVKCISVDSPSKTYLITRAFVPTHNSILGLISTVYGQGPVDDGVPMYPGAIFGKNIGWLTSTNKNADKIIWPKLMECIEGLDRSAVRVREKLKMIDFLDSGGSISVWSAQAPDSVRGDGLDGVVFDEAAFPSNAAYLWFDVLRPSLMDGKGWGFLISTPNGENWWYKLWENIPQMSLWKRWQKASNDNPLIDDEEMQSLIEEAIVNGKDPRQEVYAEFRSPEGAIWDADYFDEMLVPDIIDHGDQTSFAVAGMDHAKGLLRGDYPALINLFQSRGVYTGMANMRKMPETEKIADTVEWIRAMPKRIQPVILAVEIGALKSDTKLHYDLFANTMQRALFDANLTTVVKLQSHGGVEKKLRILRLSKLISQRRLKILNDPCGKLVYHQTKNLGVKKMADDGPDAIEIAHRMKNRIAGQILKSVQ